MRHVAIAQHYHIMITAQENSFTALCARLRTEVAPHCGNPSVRTQK